MGGARYGALGSEDPRHGAAAIADPGRMGLYEVTDPAAPDSGPPIGTPPTRELAAEESLLPPAPVGWSDPLTGADGPRYWDRVISSEQARIRRYKRSATIAFVEISGLDELVQRWGGDVAERMFVKLARTLAREVRSSDYIARVEPTRFAILLTDTNEIAAINFAERARSACEAQLGLARDVLRVGIGWSSPSAAGDLSTALDVAARRLTADLEPPA